LIPSACTASTEQVVKENLYICAESETENDLLSCRKAEYEKSKKEISTLVSNLENTYRIDEPDLVPVFEKSQSAWITYAEAECHVQTYYSRSGSAFDVYWLSCMSTENKKRIRTLQQLTDSP